jgi:hypothetical protein
MSRPVMTKGPVRPVRSSGGSMSNNNDGVDRAAQVFTGCVAMLLAAFALAVDVLLVVFVLMHW